MLFLGDLGDFERDDLVDFVSSSLSFPSRFFFFDFLSFFLSELGKVDFSYRMEMNLWKGVAQIGFGFHPALSSFSFSLDSKDQLQKYYVTKSKRKSPYLIELEFSSSSCLRVRRGQLWV